RIFLAITCLFTISLSLYGQGQIISSDEANQLYGSPENTVRIYSTVVESLLDTHEYIMIKIEGDNVNVLGKNRAPVIQQFEVEDQDVYFVFESKILKELLQLGTENESYIELRIVGSTAQNKDGNTITSDGEITTVTNGENSLIPAFVCPPTCFAE
ncbi:MAG TPA: hypothetical protein VK982_08975, partial [Bacteroidales bacterium]|nr:hypothetical protein [Bacteroidales bacterium]